MEHYRDETTGAMLGEIIAEGTAVVASFFNDIVGQEGLGEEEGYVHDGSGPLMPVQEEGYVHDGSGPLMPVQEEGYVHDGSSDTMEVQEGDRVDCSGDRTESGQVYIY